MLAVAVQNAWGVVSVGWQTETVASDTWPGQFVFKSDLGIPRLMMPTTDAFLGILLC